MEHNDNSNNNDMSLWMQQNLRPLEGILKCKKCRNYWNNATTTTTSSTEQQCGQQDTYCRSCVAVVYNNSAVPNFTANELVENVLQLRTKLEKGEIAHDDWRMENSESDNDQAASLWFGLPKEEEMTCLEDNILRPLQPILETLSCKICRNLYDNAVLLKSCGHTVCSLCIREHCQKTNGGKHRRKNACVECNAEFSTNIDKHLVTNRVVQEAVVAFQQLVERLEIRRRRQGPAEEQRRSPRRAARTSFGGAVIAPPPDEQPITEKLPSRNYDKTKLKDLKDLCSKYQLNCTGKEDEIKSRLRRFTVLWNAELDSIHPKKPSDLVRRIHKEERDKAAARSQEMYNGSRNQSILMQNLTSSIDHEKGIAGSKATTGNEQLNEKLDNNFAKMIAEMKRKQRQQQSKRKVVAKNGGKETESGNAAAPAIAQAADGEVNNEAQQLDAGAIAKGSEKCSNGDNSGGIRAQINAPTKMQNDLLQGQSQESAIDLADDDDGSDCDNGNTDAQGSSTVTNNNVFSKRNSAAAMNKENDSSTSPPGSQQQQQQQVPQQAAAVSKRIIQNPYLSKKQQATARTDMTTSHEQKTTPAATTKRRPSQDASGTKRSKSPWQCEHCTFMNDGRMQNVCTMCRKLRDTR